MICREGSAKERSLSSNAYHKFSSKLRVTNPKACLPKKLNQIHVVGRGGAFALK
jgi:hypothetical protein